MKDEKIGFFILFIIGLYLFVTTILNLQTLSTNDVTLYTVLSLFMMMIGFILMVKDE